MSTRLTKAEADTLFREAQPIYAERLGRDSQVAVYAFTPQLFEALKMRVYATIEAERNARRSATEARDAE